MAGPALLLAESLRASFSAGGLGTAAAAPRVPGYADVVVLAGTVPTSSPWNGSTGGVLAFLATGTETAAGTLEAGALGFRCGAAVFSSSDYVYSQRDEGQQGVGPARTNSSSLVTGGGRPRPGRRRRRSQRDLRRRVREERLLAGLRQLHPRSDCPA